MSRGLYIFPARSISNPESIAAACSRLARLVAKFMKPVPINRYYDSIRETRVYAPADYCTRALVINCSKLRIYDARSELVRLSTANYTCYIRVVSRTRGPPRPAVAVAAPIPRCEVLATTSIEHPSTRSIAHH